MRNFKHIVALAVTGAMFAVADVRPMVDLKASLDGTCGKGVTCSGSLFGGCCSASGQCGSTPDYCGKGCQLQYGYCHETQGAPSPDGTCGGSLGFTCKGSKYGDCCSQFEYCGSGDVHCGEGCLDGFGNCHDTSKSETANSTSSESAPTEKSEKRKLEPRTFPPCEDGRIYTTECGAQYRIECETDHQGGDIWWPGNGWHANSLDECISGCSMWPNCVNVAWVPQVVTGPCYIKDSIGPKVPRDYVFGGVLIKNCTNGPPTATPALDQPPFATPTPTPSNCVDAFKQVKQEERDCVPCEGQGGSLPYCGADEFTDNYKFTPKTCRTVYYELDIKNTTIAPDGIPRIGLTVNGQMPGPLIEANWGDTVVVTVHNKLQDNGTSIHFHGIRQLNNSEYDGVPAITQCPIAPGDSFTYKWVATNYGTSWYHSHYAIQAWEGVLGPMIIHGPTSKRFDVDAGSIVLQDWSHRTVDSMYDTAQDAKVGGPQTMDNGLINGKNTWGVQGTANQTGKRFVLDTKFEPGKTYLFRIINSAIQSTYKFYIDNHELEVINMDFTNIKPYKTNILNLNIGQRYMVIVKANQAPGNYWMRADNQNACAKTIQAEDIKGIIRYSGSDNSIPTSTAYSYTNECVDEPLASLVPLAPLNPTASDESFSKDVLVRPNEENLFKWYLSGTTFYSRYEDPTLLSIVDNGTAPTYSGNLILDLPKEGEWIYIVIQSVIPLNHPIHLHGHDSFVLGAGRGTFSNQPLNLNNPPRRDTVNMPAAGWLVLAFETDNPGTWLMHCHIGWHTSMGFALQILEAKDKIASTVKDVCKIDSVCDNWDKWATARGFKQHDSGV